MLDKIEKLVDPRGDRRGLCCVERRDKVKHGLAYKAFVYFLCLSFLLLLSGIPRAIAEVKEIRLPIGEMISKGEVKFEARENVWKEVASAHFPIFEGVRVKTEKGLAFIALGNNSQIEVGHNSLFSLQRSDEFYLFQGQVSFRIPSGAEMIFRVGELSMGKPHPIHASNSPLRASSRSEETVGSITLHSNGSVTVNSIRGPLSVQGQNRVVLASVSPEESVTIPSTTVLGEQRVILAQVGEPIEEPGMAPPFGLESWAWVWIPVGLAAIAIPVVIIASQDDDDDDFIIISP